MGGPRPVSMECEVCRWVRERRMDAQGDLGMLCESSAL